MNIFSRRIFHLFSRRSFQHRLVFLNSHNLIISTTNRSILFRKPSTMSSTTTTSIFSFTDDELASFFRAIHYVAARKEKVPTTEETTTENETTKTVVERLGISDITNSSQENSMSDKSESSQRSSSQIDSNSSKSSTNSITDQSMIDSTPKTPFERFRGKYLSVTDFASQLWCEQQMEYKYDPPPGVVISEKPQMITGTDLHLARELEFQDIVEIEVTSREDTFALKLLNIIAVHRDFLSGEHTIRREVPIFGAPFGLGLFVVGIIDEVKYDSRSRKVDIVELKTRLTAKLPSKAQKRTHDLQVMLYRRMWNDLSSGQLRKDEILKHMQLQPDAQLGDEISKEIRKLNIFTNAASISLDELLDRFFQETARLPSADQLWIEYCHQATKERFAVDPVEYKEPWLRAQLDQAASYWNGKRDARGVDIEEVWKCRFCDFVDVCAWRAKRRDECASKNRRNFVENASIIFPRQPQ